MFDINFLNKPGIQEKNKKNKKISNINKNDFIKEDTIPKKPSQDKVSFRYNNILILFSVFFFGLSIYFYMNYSKNNSIYIEENIDVKEIFSLINKNVSVIGIDYIKLDNNNLLMNINVIDNKNFYTLFNNLSKSLGNRVRGYHLNDTFTLSIKLSWYINRVKKIDLNLFDKELSDFDLKIKKELYKDKLIVISDIINMLKIINLITDLDLIHDFNIYIKRIDSLPNSINLYQIVIS